MRRFENSGNERNEYLTPFGRSQHNSKSVRIYDIILGVRVKLPDVLG